MMTGSRPTARITPSRSTSLARWPGEMDTSLVLPHHPGQRVEQVGCGQVTAAAIEDGHVAEQPARRVLLPPQQSHHGLLGDQLFSAASASARRACPMPVGAIREATYGASSASETRSEYAAMSMATTASTSPDA